MPPFVRHRAAHAHVLDVHVTLDVRTRLKEYRVAIKCRDESRHVNYGKTYTLPIKFWKDPLGPWKLQTFGSTGTQEPFIPLTLGPWSP